MNKPIYALTQKEESPTKITLYKLENFIFEDTKYELLKLFNSLDEYYDFKKKKTKRKPRGYFDFTTVFLWDATGNIPICIIENVKSERMRQVNARLRGERCVDAKQHIIDALPDDIIDGLGLLRRGTDNAQSLGLANIAAVLGISIKHDITVEHIKLLGYALGWDYKEDIEKLLANEGIINQHALITYGVNNFKDTFGSRMIGRLYKPNKRHSINNLMQAGEALGWSLISEVKELLKEYGVMNSLSFLSMNSKILNTFKSSFGILLGKTMNHISMQDRYDCIEVLGWDVASDIKQHMLTYKGKKKGLLNSLQLGIYTLDILLHYEEYFIQESCYLRSEVQDHIDSSIEKMCAQQDKKYEELPLWKIQKLGLRNVGYVLGKKITEVDSSIKTVLGKKLCIY